MKMNSLSHPLRTLVAGAVCLSILCGVLVVHAWPLWTGQSVLLPVTPVDPRDLFRGEYVRLDTPATRLDVRSDGQPPTGAFAVTPVGSWWSELPSDPSDRYSSLAGRVVYVQLEAAGESGESRPVTISITPVTNRINLRGRVESYDHDKQRLTVEYGLDSYFMQEGTAKPVEDALRMRRRVQMEVAVTAAGHARIRRLLVDGVAAGR
jgi:uncharacterized membrane-anchored protein